MNPANMTALTSLLLGQTGAAGSGNSGGGQPPAPVNIPFSMKSEMQRRLRTGDTADVILQEYGKNIPGLTKQHILDLAGGAWNGKPNAQPAKPEPAPASVTEPPKSGIGDYFMQTVLGSSSATLRNATIPVNTSGRRPGGNTGAPRVSVRSTATHGSIQDAAAALDKKYLSGESPKPSGFPTAAPQDQRLKWIIDSGTKEVNSNMSGGFVIRNGQFVPRNKQSVGQVAPASAPESETTQHVSPRALPVGLDAKTVTLSYSDPQRSANLLRAFDTTIAGNKAQNKSMGEKLKIIHSGSSQGFDKGIWGNLAQAYVDNANNPNAQELITTLATGIYKLASATASAQSRGWTIAQTKPIIDGWNTNVTEALGRLRDGNSVDIKSFNRKLMASMRDNKEFSAYTGGINFNDFETGAHIPEKPTAPRIHTENIVPIILEDAGKVLRNQLAGEFKTSGQENYHELAQAAANFADAVLNNPDTPIAKQMASQVQSALTVGGKTAITPEQMASIAQYVALRRSNKAAQGGPVVNGYIANIVNHLNIPRQLLAGLSTSWRNPTAFTVTTDANGKQIKVPRNNAADLNAAAELIRDKRGTDWTKVYNLAFPWLNETVHANVFPASFNQITKNTNNELTRQRLSEGTQYTPEKGRTDLIISGIKQGVTSHATKQIDANQFGLGIFAPLDSANADKIANLGQAGVSWLAALPTDTYKMLVDRAFTPAVTVGKRTTKPKMIGLATRITPEHVYDKTNLTPTIANRLIHAIVYPSSDSTREDFDNLTDALRSAGALKGVVSPAGDQAVVRTTMPSQTQEAQRARTNAPRAEAFTGADFDTMFDAWVKLNYKYKGSDATSLKMRQAANYQLQRLTDKLKTSINTQAVAARGTGAANKKSNTANESLETVRRLLTARGDEMASGPDSQKHFGEFKQFLESHIGSSQGNTRRNVKQILQLLNSLPEAEKMDALAAFNPNEATRRVSLNPLGLSNQEMRDFGKQLDALVKRSPKAPQLIDLGGTLAPGVRILRKLSGDDGLKTLATINEIAGVIEGGVPIHGPRPASMGAYNDPTARAALRTVAGESKAVRGAIAGITAKDPIEGAGLQLQRSLTTNNKLATDVNNTELTSPALERARKGSAGKAKIGEKGPTGKGFRSLLGIGGATALQLNRNAKRGSN